jgi:hypothetical protein
MKFKFGIIGIAIGISILIVFFGIQDDQIENEGKRVFHVTLASPDDYENGVFTDTFQIKEGDYEFGFVPNGDSPKIITITIRGESFSFNEKFGLVGTPHETGVSTYFTWDYSGSKRIQIPKQQELVIIIDPNGNLLGPVSIDIIKNKENESGVTPNAEL